MTTDSKSNDLRDVTAAVARCYSTWGERYYNDYYGPGASYPPIHCDLVASLLNRHGACRVIDAGCGPASMLRHLAVPSRELYGFDLTPEMIEEARRVLVPLGVPAGRLWVGSVLEPAAYVAPSEAFKPYDSAVCIGVLPHLPEDQDLTLIDNLYAAVRPGGLVIVEGRNELFSLFTLNRYSHEFFVEKLMSPEHLRQNAAGEERKLEQVLSNLKAMFRTDIPPVRKGYEDEPGYDEVLSRLHNPILLGKQFEARGFLKVKILFYHFHCLPPMFGSEVPDLFRRESLAMEANPEDWRGYFMASAFIIAAERP